MWCGVGRCGVEWVVVGGVGSCGWWVVVGGG